MKRYETIVIVDPDLSEEDRGSLLERIGQVIPAKNGALIQVEEWGTKRLAYDIRKKPRGTYFRLDYCGEGALVDELERLMRIDDRFLKFMTIVLDTSADPEQIKAEMAQAEAPAETSTEEAANPGQAADLAVETQKADESSQGDAASEDKE